jgi:drug/metabolite transporter (DMT)-like permease
MTQPQAMLTALAAFFLWVVVDVAIKLGAQGALSPFMIMAIIGTVGALGVVGSSLLKHNTAVLRPKVLRNQGALCLCAVSINYFNVIALKHLPLTIFYIVVFTAPLIVAALSSLLKHEALTPAKVACVIAGFLGVIIAVAPQAAGSGELLGYAAALASTTSFALMTVGTHHASKTETTQSIQLFNALAVGATGMIGVLLEDFSTPAKLTVLMMLVGGAINLVGNVLYNKALRHTSSTNVAQLHYTQIITGALLGYLIWSEVPTWNLVAGSIVIIVSGAFVAAQAHKGEVA